jgi:hypothetical protein
MAGTRPKIQIRMMGSDNYYLLLQEVSRGLRAAKKGKEATELDAEFHLLTARNWSTVLELCKRYAQVIVAER